MSVKVQIEPDLTIFPGPKPASFLLNVASSPNDDDILHPIPRKALLSKRDSQIQKQLQKIGAPVWDPGTTIRLLPETVHIRTDSKNSIDPNTPPPPAIPRRLTLPLTRSSDETSWSDRR